LLARPVAGSIVEDRRIGNLLDQPGAEYRGWNPEDHVVVGDRGREVGLRQQAVGRTGSPADGEQSVHPAVGGSIGIADKPRFPHWAVDGEKRRHGILGAVRDREGDLRVDRRARAAERGLRMAAAAAVEIHPRSQSVGDVLDLGEIVSPDIEVLGLRVAQTAQRSTGAGSSDPKSGILRPERLRCDARLDCQHRRRTRDQQRRRRSAQPPAAKHTRSERFVVFHSSPLGPVTPVIVDAAGCGQDCSPFRKSLENRG
jgi:hypothetical protein